MLIFKSLNSKSLDCVNVEDMASFTGSLLPPRLMYCAIAPNTVFFSYPVSDQAMRLLDLDLLVLEVLVADVSEDTADKHNGVQADAEASRISAASVGGGSVDLGLGVAIL